MSAGPNRDGGPPRLSIANLKKAFGATIALSSVSLSARAGEVHALVGENGAGKSTLLKVLAGVHAPDSGELRLNGEIYRPTSPVHARAAGVAMVHQELSLCPHLTVTENVLLGIEPRTLGVLHRKTMREKTVAVLARVTGEGRAAIDPEARVGDLPPATQQLVEIARALAQPSCRVLILDEPTSSLGRDDAERLFSLVRSLRDEGLTILYVSHFLEEVQRIADRYTVLRDGSSITTGEMQGTSADQLVRAMVGRSIDELFPRTKRTAGEAILVVEGLASTEGKAPAEPAVKDASLTLHRGEVLGIAGLVGAGRTELVRTIFGLDPVTRGTVRVAAFVGAGSPGARLAQGVGFLSEDRKGEGLATGLSIQDNLTLSRLDGLGPFGLVFPSRQAAAAARWIKELGIRCREPGQPIGDLSGGNQQKVAIARLLHHAVDVFLLDEPTRGIDVGSKALIYALIDELATAGKAVLMVSSYLPELLGTCDRVAVMRRGRLGLARAVSELDEAKILTEATGV